MLGEYNNLPFLFPADPEHRDVPDDPKTKQQQYDWPNDLLNCIKKVMGSTCSTPSAPEFRFELSE